MSESLDTEHVPAPHAHAPNLEMYVTREADAVVLREVDGPQEAWIKARRPFEVEQ